MRVLVALPEAHPETPRPKILGSKNIFYVLLLVSMVAFLNGACNSARIYLALASRRLALVALLCFVLRLLEYFPLASPFLLFNLSFTTSPNLALFLFASKHQASLSF